MPYIIFALDYENRHEQREQIRQAHRAHLKQAGKKILAAGALLDDDGSTIIGGMSLLDTEDREEAERFAHEDPYAKAGIRKQTLVMKWRKRWWDGEFLA